MPALLVVTALAVLGSACGRHRSAARACTVYDTSNAVSVKLSGDDVTTKACTEFISRLTENSGDFWTERPQPVGEVDPAGPQQRELVCKLKTGSEFIEVSDAGGQSSGRDWCARFIAGGAVEVTGGG
jgi:hypothetical protein